MSIAGLNLLKREESGDKEEMGQEDFGACN